VIEQLVGLLDNRDPTFWATHAGAELDLRVVVGGRTLGFEIKRTDRPSTTRSTYSALDDLALDHLYVVHAGHDRFALAPKITAIPAAELLTVGINSAD
jgi:uncharacterized protein